MQCFDSDRQKPERMQQLWDVVSKVREKCPWDKIQTHRSLGSCMIDETAEALAAAELYERLGDPENLCEELGDLLFLILLQSKIAEEEGIFTLEDVIDGIEKKMIRRHPHVFPDQENRGKNLSWEEIKRQEKSGKSDSFFQEQKKILFHVQKEMIHYLEKETEKHGSDDMD
ncbi:MAG: MazG nucleotide pyrophosphohydrolase domain-containing protein [Eubacteriales bacterium]|nr:MazG nucleotide pyrophosphohydrolase domain-containing protein [Eubacteriales bacterium]